MGTAKELKEWIAQSRNVVFFGGAGVSTESGIPDFRSPDKTAYCSIAIPAAPKWRRSF